jgi:hypothetical protein
MGFAFLTASLGTISFFSLVVTSQPWQVFGWTEVNYGEKFTYVSLQST